MKSLIWHRFVEFYYGSDAIKQLPFFRGREWTGEYLLDFKDLITSEKQEVTSTPEEARFSFIKGAYVEDNYAQGTYALGSIHPSFCEQVLCFNSAVDVAYSYSHIDFA
jgi:hypothetical protein